MYYNEHNQDLITKDKRWLSKCINSSNQKADEEVSVEGLIMWMDVQYVLNKVK